MLTDGQTWTLLAAFITAMGVVGALTVSQVAGLREHIRDSVGDLRTLLQAQFAMVEKRFDGVDQRFDRVETRLDRVETRLDRVETRLDRVETKVDQLDHRMERLESKSDATDRDIQTLIERWYREHGDS